MKITITKDEKTSLELIGFCAILVISGAIFGWFLQPVCPLVSNASANDTLANDMEVTAQTNNGTCNISCSTTGKRITECPDGKFSCELRSATNGGYWYSNIIPIELQKALVGDGSAQKNHTVELLDRYCKRQTGSGTGFRVEEMTTCENECTSITSVDGSSWVCYFSLR